MKHSPVSSTRTMPALPASNACTGVLDQAVRCGGAAAFRGFPVYIDLPLEDVNLAVAAGGHFDAKLGAPIDEGGLGREDLEAAGLFGRNLDRGFAQFQPGGVGRKQLEGGRALQG